MAILRAKEIKELTKEELEEKQFQLNSDLMKIRGVLASGGIPENVGKAKEIKRTIARIKTFTNRKEEKTKPKTSKK
jgi:large subunit ribosomal protein L29